MATKLKGLEVTKVDFVDEGANPDADIKVFKKKDGKEKSAARARKGNRNILKNLLGFIGKAAGLSQNEIESALDEIQKGDSVSFEDVFNERKNRQIADEIWDVCYALQSSLCSILNDAELDNTDMATAMQESLGDFQSVVSESIENWSSGKTIGIVKTREDVSDYELEMAKSAVNKLNKLIEKSISEPVGNGPDEKDLKGEEEMKIDKSKLTDAERAFLDSIEKRCGEGNGDDVSGEGVPPTSEGQGEPNVQKSTGADGEGQNVNNPEDTHGDVYKGLDPAVAAELQALKKFREDAEDRELAEVAKKYEIIGKKEEELVPVLKSLKAAGGTAYNDMIAVLDQTVEMVEKSGAFSEIGKAGHGSGENSAEAKIGSIAKGIMEKDTSITYEQAVAKAWTDHPELIAEYEEQEGF